MDVEIKPSRIHGRGVFALRNYRAGELVLRWDTSRRVSVDQASALEKVDGVYLHPYDATSFLIGQSPECFVNHSCDNNTEVHDFTDVAVRDIAEGEEITSNYETDGAGLSFACHCGSAVCRGIVGKMNV